MKRIALIAVVVMLAGCDEAGGYFNGQTKQLHNTAVGRLEAAGQDLRIYEFTPQTMPNHKCIYVAGDRKGGLFCAKDA